MGNKKFAKKIFCHTPTVQSLFSTTCGHYCVYFILYRCHGYSMRDIVSRFSSNLTENDRNINLFIRAFM